MFFGNIFISEVLADYFINFYKKQKKNGNSVGKIFWGAHTIHMVPKKIHIVLYYYIILCIYYIYIYDYISNIYIYYTCIIIIIIYIYIYYIL